MSDAPRTREEWRRIQRLPDGRYGSEITYKDLAHGMSNFAKQLERELATVTEQRDRLAEAMERILSYQGRFGEEDPESIAAEALAAVKGGQP